MGFLPQQVIADKRDGRAHSAADIAAFIAGLTDGTVSEAQAAAWAMAVVFNDMTDAERVALTLAMRDSGDVLDWSHLDGPVLDKHSTGGVGDNVSLMLAPILAACGAYVPMISGRGLGHTGGTLDKFDAIPGYETAPDLDRFRTTVAEAGCAIIGPTANLAPADGRLYAIRDVTATVASIPLIVASILSKKLAAGLDGLVLDVKTGSGAFMPELPRSKALADSLVAVANGAGLKTTALITDMNEPLAPVAGNALEMRAAVDFLTGKAQPPRLRQVVLALCSAVMEMTGHPNPATAAERALDTGKAAERFAKMVALLGGPADFIDNMDAHLPAAPVIRDVTADGSGILSAIDTRALGMAVVELGGGRRQPSDTIRYDVGFDAIAPLGTALDPATPIARVHAATAADAETAIARLRAAITIGDSAPNHPLIAATIPPTGAS